MTTLADIRTVPGLEDYLDALEERLARTVATHPGLVAAVGNEALAAGGKRLRPALVFLSAPPGRRAVARGRRRGRARPHGDARPRRPHRPRPLPPRQGRRLVDLRPRRSARDRRLPLRARLLGAERDGRRRRGRDPRRRDACLARGEALQRTQTRDPGTTVEAYLERCALKTGKLFEAACRLGGGSGEYGLALGIAFQIADDVLDCSGATIETGKIAGTDLRDGTPTLPLLLAAQRDAVVRAALAGGPMDGALVRVAATGALDESREVALDYARQARARLDGELHRDELEALTHAVVDRER